MQKSFMFRCRFVARRFLLYSLQGLIENSELPGNSFFQLAMKMPLVLAYASGFMKLGTIRAQFSFGYNDANVAALAVRK